MKKKYLLIAFLGLALWFGETWYFGFNAKPSSNVEKMLDIFSQVLIIWGIVGDILSNITVIKKYDGDTINTKNFNYVDKRPDGKNTFKAK